MSRSFGVILLSDDFDYANGALVDVSSGKWTTHSGTGEMDVASGHVNVDQSDGEDVNSLLDGQPYSPSGTTNIFYASFDVKFTSLPSASGTYFAHFKDASNSGFRARIWATTAGATQGSFRLGISSVSGTTFVTNTTELSLNVDYKIVTRLVNSNSVATLWIAPSDEGSASISTSENSSVFTVVAYAFRQSGGEGVMQIDNLKVGTSFDDVVSTGSVTAPEITTQPQSQTVNAGESATFSVAANGTAPLHYQWKFNGNSLSNATSSVLLLTNVTSANAGDYSVLVSNNAGETNSDIAVLTLNTPAPVASISLLTYNTKGNGATNWSTNAPQVQAIGREVQFLQPDIITFQEIPLDLSSEMTNFITAFLPGYFLARNSGTDGFIRSVIASRFPITRSTSWLDGADLKPYGYTNTDSSSADNFTRDLFEAQITIPGFSRPLHVFTTHLKSSSGGYTEAAAKRAAEAAAITNFFATNFFVNYPNDPYTLSGDMNESDTNALVIQRLVSAPSGLRLTNPTDPNTGKINTYSIQGSLSERIDYIFPCGLLFSNIVSSEVFRTDSLNPLPGGLLANDDKTASDHLPVFMTFANPYNVPFRITSVTVSNGLLSLNWESISGREYRVESSTTLTNWTPLSATLTATGTNSTFSTNLSSVVQFLRVNQLP
jgi:endonuclease/exonuclease/phosphatase family metal-dependent hydrolase